MPFDGTDLKLAENHPLTKLGEVERLLASEEHWCKGKLRDSNGRHCLVGAMQAVRARQMLEPIILRAAREVRQKHYWRVELFNDDPRTTHAEVLRALQRARENIIAGIIEADPRAPWIQRFAKTAGLLHWSFRRPIRSVAQCIGGTTRPSASRHAITGEPPAAREICASL